MQGSDTNNDEKTNHRSAEETDEKGIHVFAAAQKTTEDELCQMILKKDITPEPMCRCLVHPE
eukprot:853111-Amphidinium_carterae.1